MAISFKSVGNKTTARKFTRTRSPVPIGIKTPLELGTGRSGLFKMHFNLPDTIHDNLRNLIMTNNGERLGRYDFGANLRELTTELVAKDSFDAEAMMRINQTAGKFMPFVELETFDSKFYRIAGSSVELDLLPDEGIAKIEIEITYNVPKLRIAGKKLGLTIFTIG